MRESCSPCRGLSILSTQPIDEFDDDTLDPDTIRAIDEAQHGFEHSRKKVKLDVIDLDD